MGHFKEVNAAGRSEKARVLSLSVCAKKVSAE
jgi:hypothetical protein